MNRPTLLVASRHPGVAAALRQYLALFLSHGAMAHELDWSAFGCAADLFAALDRLGPGRLRDTLVVFDLGGEGAAAWDVEDLRGDGGLAAHLVLAYPEVYFVFLGTAELLERRLPSPAPAGWKVVAKYHFVSAERLLDVVEAVRLHAAGFRTLFDATGLRALLKRLLFDIEGAGPNLYERLSASRQGHVAAVADDELAFVYLNGYAAYKAGYRAWLASTEAEFRRLLLTRPAPAADGPPPVPAAFDLVLSDWDLVYADHEGPRPTDSLLLCVSFEPGERLIIVTSYREHDGQAGGAGPKAVVVAGKTQKALLVAQKGLRAPKPYGGFFDLVRRPVECPGEDNPLHQRYAAAWARVLDEGRGQRPAPAAAGPPRGAPGARPAGHGAPNAHAAVAARLLLRANAIGAGEAQGGLGWVQKALLAGEAKEILGGLARMAAYEAIAAQTEAEVLAEVTFFGLQVHEEGVRARLEPLRQEAALVERSGRNPAAAEGREEAPSWGTRREEEEARFSFLRRAVHGLRLRFAEYEQVEAAEECLRHFSVYETKLERLRLFGDAGLDVVAPGSLLPGEVPAGGSAHPAGTPPPFRRFVAILQWVGSLYVDLVTRAGTSVGRLLLSSVLVALGFGVVYYALLQAYPPEATHPRRGESLGFALWHSGLTFALQPSISDVEQLKERYADLRASLWYRAVMLLQLTLAYVHLGLLVTVLHRRITKRAP